MATFFVIVLVVITMVILIFAVHCLENDKAWLGIIIFLIMAFLAFGLPLILGYPIPETFELYHY